MWWCRCCEALDVAGIPVEGGTSKPGQMEGGREGGRWEESVGMRRIWPVIGSLASWYPMGMGPMPGGGTGGTLQGDP